MLNPVSFCLKGSRDKNLSKHAGSRLRPFSPLLFFRRFSFFFVSIHFLKLSAFFSAVFDIFGGLAMIFNATAERLLHASALDTPPEVERHMSTRSPEQVGVYICSVLVAVVSGTLLCLRLYIKVRILRRTDLTDCSLPSSFWVYRDGC